ncbi:MAG: hypothetical protein LBP34_04460 [Flavobacteriaceae bacterium]|jgi:hypothetical protein|nr:hypothetical protein [Flavobacteriaceae bacterium]
MKKFITKIILFMLPVIVGAYLGDYLISKKIRESGIGDFSVWEDIYNGRINADIAIYGSSRAANHINPMTLEKELNSTAYNLGMVGQNIWLQNLRHIEYLKYNRKPKVLIYSLDDFLLFNDPIGIYQPDQFSPYIFWPERTEIKKQLSVYEHPPFTYFDYKVPLLRYVDSYYTNKALELVRNTIFSYISKLKLSDDDTTPKPEVSKNENTTETEDATAYNLPGKKVKGYIPRNLTWNNDLDEAQASMKNFHTSVNKKGIRLFEKMINELQQKNILVVFVYTPEYVEGQKFIKNRAQVMKIYKDISKKYNIPFYDYSKDSMSYEKKYFFNSLHLNAAGAELFSEKLAKDLKPVLQESLKKQE